MNRRLLILFLTAGMLAVFFGCSNKNSNEACLQAVTMNLDSGNYNAVITSPCADELDKGAAYVGLAGFDVTGVINALIRTGAVSGSTGTQSDLSVYLTTLVTNVTTSSLAYMNDAVSAYSQVTTTSATGNYTYANYQDAQFYISLVDALKSLSLLQLLMPNLLNSNGALNTACDYNDNGVPDNADAAACALIAAANISTGSTLACSGATYSPAVPIPLYLKDSLGTAVTGTYSGLTITMTPVAGGSAAACNPPNTTSYQKLLYQDPTTGKWWVATTTTETCTDVSNSINTWPCPLVQNSQPLDFVSTFNQSMTGSISSLNSSLTTSATSTTTTDVQTALQDIQGQACCGCTTSPCAPCTTSCTSQDIANYIQTNLR
ncbi:MAG TPA: hypothetical protein VEI57_11315 [Nitrospirota bacterium]|nr:hypothetical protein [Nitrospirota bacterium]